MSSHNVSDDSASWSEKYSENQIKSSSSVLIALKGQTDPEQPPNTKSHYVVAGERRGGARALLESEREVRSLSERSKKIRDLFTELHSFLPHVSSEVSKRKSRIRLFFLSHDDDFQEYSLSLSHVGRMNM